jgi:translocation and assembly module TamB
MLPLDLELPRFDVTLPERQIEARVEGDSIPLSLVAIFTDQLEDIQGRSEASVLVRGTPKNVVLQGQATLFDGGFRIVSSGITYKELQGRLLFKGQVVELRDVSLRGAERGRGYFFGSVNFKELGNPRFDMEMAADHLPGYNQFDARLVMSGTAKLKGPYESPVITGNLSVVSGVLLLEEIGRRREIIDPYIESFVLIDTLFAIEQGLRRTGNPFLDNLDLNVNVTVERDTWLRSEETNVEIAGDLRVRMLGFPGEYKIDGTLNALRGEYWFFNKRFTVSGGTIDFVGTPGMNPNLRIIALYTVRTQKEPIDIRLIVGGTLENMTLTLESDQQPPIPESDLLSYLLFGRPSYELTRTSEESNLLQDVTAGVPQAFFGYALGSLIARESGIAYVDITRAPIVPTGEGEYRTGLGPALTATQVEVGWYLAPTIFVSVAQQLVGVVRPTVRLEWRLDKRLTVRGITEPRFGNEGTLFPGGPVTDLEQSIGLFLFYGWAY